MVGPTPPRTASMMASVVYGGHTAGAHRPTYTAGAHHTLAVLGGVDGLLIRLCSQMLAPPQSLHLFLWRLCSHVLRPLCGALSRCICLPLSHPPPACPCSTESSACCPAVLPSASSSRHSRHFPRFFPPALGPSNSSCPFATRTVTARPCQDYLSLGPAVAGVAAPVKRTASCAHCGHLGVLPLGSAQAGWEGAAGALSASEGGRAAYRLAAQGAGEGAVEQRGACRGRAPRSCPCRCEAYPCTSTPSPFPFFGLLSHSSLLFA
jgi:hypothetical protein